MKNIITVCRAGLVRSAALADVLKLHFRPVDVVPVGIELNYGLLDLVFGWADQIIVMEEKYASRIAEQWRSKVLVCEVGPDTYGTPKNPQLIHTVWQWARANQELLGITEHQDYV